MNNNQNTCEENLILMKILSIYHRNQCIKIDDIINKFDCTTLMEKIIHLGNQLSLIEKINDEPNLIKIIDTRYKLRPCGYYFHNKRKCAFSLFCKFIHSEEELCLRYELSPLNEDIQSDKLKETINHQNNKLDEYYEIIRKLYDTINYLSKQCNDISRQYNDIKTANQILKKENDINKAIAIK